MDTSYKSNQRTTKLCHGIYVVTIFLYCSLNVDMSCSLYIGYINGLMVHNWTIKYHHAGSSLVGVFCVIIYFTQSEFMMTSSNGNIFRVAGQSSVYSPHIGQWRGALMFSLNKRLSKQWWGWRFETPSRPLWHYCNVGGCGTVGGVWDMGPIPLIWANFNARMDNQLHPSLNVK